MLTAVPTEKKEFLLQLKFPLTSNSTSVFFMDSTSNIILISSWTGIGSKDLLPAAMVVFNSSSSCTKRVNKYTNLKKVHHNYKYVFAPTTHILISYPNLSRRRSRKGRSGHRFTHVPVHSQFPMGRTYLGVWQNSFYSANCFLQVTQRQHNRAIFHVNISIYRHVEKSWMRSIPVFSA